MSIFKIRQTILTDITIVTSVLNQTEIKIDKTEKSKQKRVSLFVQQEQQPALFSFTIIFSYNKQEPLLLNERHALSTKQNQNDDLMMKVNIPEKIMSGKTCLD